MMCKDPLGMAKAAGLVPVPSYGRGDGTLKVCSLSNSGARAYFFEVEDRVHGVEQSGHPQTMKIYARQTEDLRILGLARDLASGNIFSEYGGPFKAEVPNITDTEGISRFMAQYQNTRDAVGDTIYLAAVSSFLKDLLINSPTRLSIHSQPLMMMVFSRTRTPTDRIHPPCTALLPPLRFPPLGRTVLGL